MHTDLSYIKYPSSVCKWLYVSLEPSAQHHLLHIFVTCGLIMSIRLCLITAVLLGLWSAVEILDDVVVAKTNCSYKVKRLQMKTCFVIVGTMKMTQHNKEMFIDNIFIVLFWQIMHS